MGSFGAGRPIERKKEKKEQEGGDDRTMTAATEPRNRMVDGNGWADRDGTDGYETIAQT
jgi:hypothetical protein